MMADNVLEIRELSKDYGDFVLDKVSFALPRGVIMGLILVMQSGIIVEHGTTADLFAAPHKEWTKEFVRLAMAEEGGGWTWQKSKSEM